MIIDSHCHIWKTWPFDTIEPMVAYPNSKGIDTVPDPENKASVEQLIFEMDLNDVDQAAVVCVSIQRNQDNNDYVAECVNRYPDRLIQFADLDGSRSPTYHTPGAADRLEKAVAKYNLKGFAHYIKRGDDGSWYFSEDGLAFLAKTAELGQIASISCHEPERMQPIMRQIAERCPSVPFIMHHLGLLSKTEPARSLGLKEVLASAKMPNIYVKLSGPYYISQKPWDYPFLECAHVIRSLYEYYGPDRLVWGSDYPMVRDSMNYRQSIEHVRTHCSFIPDEDKEKILGGNLHRLLTQGHAD